MLGKYSTTKLYSLHEFCRDTIPLITHILGIHEALQSSCAHTASGHDWCRDEPTLAMHKSVDEWGWNLWHWGGKRTWRRMSCSSFSFCPGWDRSSSTCSSPDMDVSAWEGRGQLQGGKGSQSPEGKVGVCCESRATHLHSFESPSNKMPVNYKWKNQLCEGWTTVTTCRGCGRRWADHRSLLWLLQRCIMRVESSENIRQPSAGTLVHNLQGTLGD
jgi:hypothetical protein